MNAFYFLLAMLFLFNVFALILNINEFSTGLIDILKGDVKSFIQNSFNIQTVLSVAGILVVTYFIGGSVVRNVTGIAILFSIIFTTNLFLKPNFTNETINLYFTLFFNFLLLVAMLTFLAYR